MRPERNNFLPECKGCYRQEELTDQYCSNCDWLSKAADWKNAKVVSYFCQSEDTFFSLNEHQEGKCYVYAHVWLKYKYKNEYNNGEFYQRAFERPESLRNKLQELDLLIYDSKLTESHKWNKNSYMWSSLNRLERVALIGNDVNIRTGINYYCKDYNYSIHEVAQQLKHLIGQSAVIVIYDEESQSAHALAVILRDNKFNFFDPNYGELEFDDINTLIEFIPEYTEVCYPTMTQITNIQPYTYIR